MLPEETHPSVSIITFSNKMDKLQFNFEEDSLYSPLSPDVIDISSGSEDAFSIAPGNTQQLEEKFRVNPAGSNLMAAFVGSSMATLYPNSTVPQGNHETTVAGGSQIEKNLMELMSDPRDEPTDSPASFVDSEFEESNLFPWMDNRGPAQDTNHYGRPCVRVMPVLRENQDENGILPTPMSEQTPSGGPDPSVMQNTLTNDNMEYEPHDVGAQSQIPVPRNMQGFSLSPMLFPMQITDTAQEMHQTPLIMQQTAQIGFPFNTVHSSNVLLIPPSERQGIRLLPTVMPNVAGYCELCGKCFDQVALETLGQYLVATEYESETVKERKMRSKAFIHGFEAALFLFKNAGLSHPPRCDGSGVQL